jgi:hypothetical protein
MRPLRSPLLASSLLAASLLLACDPGPAPLDAAPPDAPPSDVRDVPPDAAPADAPVEGACEGPPGLYREGSCTELADGVRRFTPRYALWSDGAEKERFVFLPEGATIDASDPDGWIYPVGTVFYKTFSRDGLRIETRRNEKVREGAGLDAWRMQTFAWSADQRSVTEVTAGVVDALGTGHDIPSASLCVRCHAGAPTDVALGFTAIQLNHAGSDVSLTDLIADGALSTPIALEDAVIPGDEAASEALGYLHANCGACHGGSAAPAGLRFWIAVGTPDVTMTSTYVTAVGRRSSWPGAAERILSGDPDASAVILRMSTRMPGDQMPPVATELTDPTGIAAVRTWIEAL